MTPAELVTAAMKARPQSITDCGYLAGYGRKYHACFAVTKATLADVGKLALGERFARVGARLYSQGYNVRLEQIEVRFFYEEREND